MLNTILACHRIFCGRSSNIRSVNATVNNGLSSEVHNSNRIKLSLPPEDEKISKKYSSSGSLIISHTNTHVTDKIISTPNQLYEIQCGIDLDRLAKEYLETINEYRCHLGFISLELSNELTHRAVYRATQLSIQDHTENTNRSDLIYNNEPIGETYENFFTTISNSSLTIFNLQSYVLSSTD
ncbi:unnamed protein product [Rotaria sp. Silwood2]|nr:unnamed protein product [Rotaria sp. Silwood2]CAF2737281.1 unnamed protein product [Rotaria sp. Silwood2]CAF4583591.1 unnamed protein product [Rotaria sp. Silwood2]CAF4609268.1 unnamed protein product [Rotaria sp. Silwood2]